MYVNRILTTVKISWSQARGPPFAGFKLKKKILFLCTTPWLDEGPGAVVKAACLESRIWRVRPHSGQSNKMLLPRSLVKIHIVGGLMLWGTP